MNKCLWHCCEKKVQKKFCSNKCKNKYYVDQRRKNIKKQAVEYKGGKCCLCGYNKCFRALEFHHRDGKKDFGISHKGHTHSWERVKEELDKCIMVCSNCHAEIHHTPL